MSDTPLRREVSGPWFESTNHQPHAGLLLSRGLGHWSANSTEKGSDFQQHVAKVTRVPAPPIYVAAYARWLSIVARTPTIASWVGRTTRCFIGMGGPSVVQAAITLARTYGVPMIPGSAQKGLARAAARESGLDQAARTVLFGASEAGDGDPDAGYVLFHDAWWVPGSEHSPLVPEIVTVHHPEYYATEGERDATDFDSPVPNVQVAAHGCFLFGVECQDLAWSALARDLLAGALQDLGIGGKTSAGYGRFVVDDKATDRIAAMRKHEELAQLSPADRLRREVSTLTETQLAERLSKDRNKWQRKLAADWETFLGLIREMHGERVRSWKDSPEKHRSKAYKTLFARSGGD